MAEKGNLCDVNVLLALAHERHVHAKRASRWMEASIGAKDSVLVCRVAQMGLLRLLTNPMVMKEDVVTASKAWGVLDAFLADARFRFVGEPPEIEGIFRRLTASQPGSRVQWTDAYLAAFALAGGLRLVTFDRDFSRFQNLDLRIPES